MLFGVNMKDLIDKLTDTLVKSDNLFQEEYNKFILAEKKLHLAMIRLQNANKILQASIKMDRKYSN